MDLPREVRDMIYSLAADWNDATAHMSQMMKELQRYCDPVTWIAEQSEVSDEELCLDSDESFDSDFTEDSEFVYDVGVRVRARKPVFPKRATPTILLLNRQINREADAVLSTKTFQLKTLDGRDVLNYSYQYGPESPIFRLISIRTIKRIPKIEIKLSTDCHFTEPCFHCFPTCETPGHTCDANLKPSYIQNHLIMRLDNVERAEWEDDGRRIAEIIISTLHPNNANVSVMVHHGMLSLRPFSISHILSVRSVPQVPASHTSNRAGPFYGRYVWLWLQHGNL